jgi:hypothetical protein
MLMSKWAMSSAAGQVRSIEASTTRLVDELTSAGVWSGNDADRFERDWNELVRARLLRAAQKMDAVQFETLD